MQEIPIDLLISKVVQCIALKLFIYSIKYNTQRPLFFQILFLQQIIFFTMLDLFELIWPEN